jgi:hypothetical protein
MAFAASMVMCENRKSKSEKRRNTMQQKSIGRIALLFMLAVIVSIFHSTAECILLTYPTTSRIEKPQTQEIFSSIKKNVTSSITPYIVSWDSPEEQLVEANIPDYFFWVGTTILAQKGKDLKCDKILASSISKRGDRYSLSFRLIDTERECLITEENYWFNGSFESLIGDEIEKMVDDIFDTGEGKQSLSRSTRKPNLKFLRNVLSGVGIVTAATVVSMIVSSNKNQDSAEEKSDDDRHTLTLEW